MSLKTLFVKQVLSGDCLVLRERSKSGPPPERVIAINSITCPRLARKPGINSDSNEGTIDEPFAWDAREFTRKICIGQEVWFSVERVAPGGREYANVFLINTNGEKENIAETIVSEGYAEVRRQNNQAGANEHYQHLLALEEQARAAHKGKFALDASNSVRQIIWNVDNISQYVETHQNQTLPALIEHVRDGCTVRAFILPNDRDRDNCYRHITLMLSGVKTPTFKLGENGEQIPELFAEEAKFFVECKLLQRKVDLRLESINNQNIVGTILHPKGNIAEFILREGFGRIVDWSLSVLPLNVVSAYRIAEKVAKEKRLRLWKDYEAPKTITALPSLNGQDKPLELNENRTISGQVLEIGNGDNITVKCSNSQHRKFFLSSIRSPKPPTPVDQAQNSTKKFRPIYDVPYMFEAREFLRKKLIGKTVKIRIDYIQPKLDQGMEERIMSTITLGDINIAEALVSKGLATVVRYRATDENRSLYYDTLLAAEGTAQKKGVGLFSKKDAPTHKVSDLTNDVSKSKQFLSSLKRLGRISGIVEFVASGSRLRIYVPKETCIFTFLCAGIECPKPYRRLPNSKEEPSEPFGEEALAFTKENFCQREVEVEVDGVDRGGNFIGWLHLDCGSSNANNAGDKTKNLSLLLIEHGFAKVHFSAEKSPIFKQMCEAEEKAKSMNKNIWQLDNQLTFAEKAAKNNLLQENPIDSRSERTENYVDAVVTEIVDGTRFYAQLVSTEKTIVSITQELQSHFSSTASTHQALDYKPKKGDLCAGKFTLDNCWYRARVLSVNSQSETADLQFVDFGNKQNTIFADTASLPSSLSKLPFQAHEYCLACVKAYQDNDAIELAKHALEVGINNRQVKINVEYELFDSKIKAVSVKSESGGQWYDEIELLLKEGVLYVDEKQKPKYLKELMAKYLSAQEIARKARLNIWRYGDIRDDDA